MTRVDVLLSPSAVAADSNQRASVDDPGAKAAHVFDFIRSNKVVWRTPQSSE
jgi:hypothetical protein